MNENTSQKLPRDLVAGPLRGALDKKAEEWLEVCGKIMAGTGAAKPDAEDLSYADALRHCAAEVMSILALASLPSSPPRRELTPSQLDKCMEDYDCGTIPRGELLSRINAALASPVQGVQVIFTLCHHQLRTLAERGRDWTEKDLRKFPTATLELIDKLSGALLSLVPPALALPLAPKPAPQCTCFERADGIGPMHGVHDSQCPLPAETPYEADQRRQSGISYGQPAAPKVPAQQKQKREEGEWTITKD